MTRPRGKPPAFQFYAGDWLIGTRALGPYGRGVYIDLLALQWATGAIEDDPSAVAAMVGADESQVRALWPRLRAKFADGPAPGTMVNVRLEAERAKQDAFRDEQASKGRASAEARRNRTSTTVQPNVNHGSTEGQPEGQPEVNSSSSSSSSSSLPNTHAQPAAERVLVSLEVAPRFDLAALYAAYPRKQGKAAGIKRLRSLIETVADYESHRAAIGHLVAHVKRDLPVDYVPHFSTWANGKWEDYRDGIPVPPRATAAKGTAPEPQHRPDTLRRLSDVTP